MGRARHREKAEAAPGSGGTGGTARTRQSCRPSPSGRLCAGSSKPSGEDRPSAGEDGAEIRALTSDLPLGVVQPQVGP